MTWFESITLGLLIGIEIILIVICLIAGHWK